MGEMSGAHACITRCPSCKRSYRCSPNILYGLTTLIYDRISRKQKQDDSEPTARVSPEKQNQSRTRRAGDISRKRVTKGRRRFPGARSGCYPRGNASRDRRCDQVRERRESVGDFPDKNHEERLSPVTREVKGGYRRWCMQNVDGDET